MDNGGRDLAPADLDALLAIPDRDEFLDRSYRAILARGPDLRGAARFARRLRFVPGYSRRRVLAKLLASEEHRAIQARQLQQQRDDLARRAQELERARADLERARRELDEREQIAEQLRRLAEQIRQVPVLHSRLLEQHHQLVEQQGQLVEQQGQLFEQGRAERQRRDALLDRLGQLPPEQAQLLGQHRQELGRQQQDALDLLRQLAQGQHDALRHALALELAQRLEPLAAAPSHWADLLAALRRDLLDELDRRGWGRAGESGAAGPEAEELARFVAESYRLILRRPPAPAELAAGCDGLRAGIGRVKGEFLHALLGCPPGGPAPQAAAMPALPAPAPTATHPEEPGSCRVCGGALAYKWSLKVLRERHLAHYHECRDCGCLQVVHPHWLAEAYADEDRPLAENPDQGRFARNYTAYAYFTALHRAGLTAERPLVLDFGGGYGLLAQMLKSGGFEAWQHDPHVPIPFLAADRSLGGLDDFPEGSFDVISALEVLEHLTDPLTTLDRLAARLKPDGSLLLSTTVYYPGLHHQGWYYLAAGWGQHVTLWSRAALRHCAGRLGFRSVGLAPGTEGFFILFSRRPADELRAKLAAATAELKHPDHLRRITAAWDLQALGILQATDAPLVEDLAAAGPLPRAGGGAA